MVRKEYRAKKGKTLSQWEKNANKKIREERYRSEYFSTTLGSKKYKTMRKFFDNKSIKSGVMPKRKRPKRDYSA